jgi:hypothetical protein
MVFKCPVTLGGIDIFFCRCQFCNSKLEGAVVFFRGSDSRNK